MDELLRARLQGFLEEDLAHGDVTSEALVPSDATAVGLVVARAPGVLAGLREALALGAIAGLQAASERADGDAVTPQMEVLRLSGNARALLGVERTLLNLLSHLSGIATATRAAVDAVRVTDARIAATRKTIPGLRDLAKRAVVTGGADPHRHDLGASVLIKDNHLPFTSGVAAAVAAARHHAGFTRRVEIEVESSADAVEAASAGADIVMLDNMTPAQVEATLAALTAAGVREGVVIEVSGGITVDNARAYAVAGADVLSMGALTASAPALDMSMRVERGADG